MPLNENYMSRNSARRSLSNSRFRSAQRVNLTSPMIDQLNRDPKCEESL